MESHNFERLKAHILPLSKSSFLETARLEWDLVGVEISEELDQSPCGQDIRQPLSHQQRDSTPPPHPPRNEHLCRGRPEQYP
jgi:hypothetical protein